MKKTISILLVLLIASALCPASYAQEGSKTDRSMKTESSKRVLVAFFSHTGENYAVGNIEKGNTHIIAEMIAEESGGTLFEIVPQNAYPKTYNACVEAAKKEKQAKARPAIKADAPVEEYDVIYLGYPNWWGDMPMPVYTFIEQHDWNGKIVIPFCTSEGSGLSDTEQRIAAACKGAALRKGLAVRGTTAQNDRTEAKKAVQAWLERVAQ